MSDELLKKCVEIGRKLGLSVNEVKDMNKFIDAVYRYVVQGEGGTSLSETDELLKLAMGSKTLEDPVRTYLLFRTIEKIRYEQGFEDALKRIKAKSEELKEIERKKAETVRKVLEMYEKHILPRVENFMTFMFPQPQQPQQSNIKIKFKD